MRIKFWGTRGSTPTPDPEFMRYGGDTSCVEVRSGNVLIILDAGTGIRRLGASLMSDPFFRGKGFIFLTHSHWDHIQGFPFFRPAFVSGNEFYIHGAFKADNRMEAMLRGQMGSLYFPVHLEELPSTLHFVELIEQDVRIGHVTVTSRHLNHPQGALGYRIDDGHYVLAYVTDTEPYPDRVDAKVLELARGADLLVYDSQFTPEEYAQGKRGWGHSTWREGVKIAHEAEAKKLVLFHHDPYHDDHRMDQIVEEARRFFPATEAAKRDMVVHLEGGRIAEALEVKPDLPSPSGGKVAEVRCSEEGDCLVIHVESDLSVLNSSDFHQKVTDALKDGSHRRLILDLSRLNFIDSSGIGTLASIYDQARQKGVELSICNPSRQILDVFRITRFTKIISIYATQNEALAGGKTLS